MKLIDAEAAVSHVVFVLREIGADHPANVASAALRALPAAVPDELIEAERSSAAEAATILLDALGWKSGGLASAAEEIVKQRDDARAALDAAVAKLEGKL